jgi:hypothetical protein
MRAMRAEAFGGYQDLKFTADSPLEEDGFELPVPPLRGGLF